MFWWCVTNVAIKGGFIAATVMLALEDHWVFAFGCLVGAFTCGFSYSNKTQRAD